MKNKIFNILFLLFTLNLFSQDFKDEYLRVSAEEPIRKNQYTVKSIYQDVNYIWIKRFMGNKTEVLTFEKCLSGLDLVKVENYKKANVFSFFYIIIDFVLHNPPLPTIKRFFRNIIIFFHYIVIC